MKKDKLFPYLLATFCTCLIVSNVLAFKVFQVFSITLPAAVILFPIVYIINDVMAEIYDFKQVRRGIFLGFALNLLAVAAYTVAIALPSPSFFEGADAFRMVLSNSGRVLIASFAAYLVGSVMNAWIMAKMKATGSRKLMLRCVLSTLVGETLDATIFISVTFAGTMPTSSLVTMVIAQAMFKTLYEIVCYPVTRAVILKIK